MILEEYFKRQIKQYLNDIRMHGMEDNAQSETEDESIACFDDKYNFAANHLFAKENKALMYVSNLIYYSYDYEQDGYVNGLYGDIMNHDIMVPSWDDIKNSSAYVGLTVLRKSIRVIERNKEKTSVIHAATLFNTNVDTLLKMGKSAEQRFINKIGKVLIKIRTDKQVLNNRKITIGQHGEINYFHD